MYIVLICHYLNKNKIDNLGKVLSEFDWKCVIISFAETYLVRNYFY